MQSMKKLIAVLLFFSMIIGCRPNQYEKWAASLTEMVGASGERYTVQDVSMLLGCTPEKCEPIPSKNNAEQCYWDVKGGRIVRVGSGFRGGFHNRYFNATCRFEDGKLVKAQSNWQF